MTSAAALCVGALPSLAGCRNARHRPSRTPGERPVTPRRAARGPGTAGPPRCAGVWPEPGRCAAPPPNPPRESESVGARGGQGLGGGAGADLRAGAGRFGGHGWARPPPSSQPETEARSRGLVRARARRAGARGPEAAGWGRARGQSGAEAQLGSGSRLPGIREGWSGAR